MPRLPRMQFIACLPTDPDPLLKEFSGRGYPKIWSTQTVEGKGGQGTERILIDCLAREKDTFPPCCNVALFSIHDGDAEPRGAG